MSIKNGTTINFAKTNDGYLNTIKHVANRLVTKIRKWQQTRREHRADRAALKQLLLLSDRHLRDIGIIRADITWASNLPRDQIATIELQKVAKSKRNRPTRNK